MRCGSPHSRLEPRVLRIVAALKGTSDYVFGLHFSAKATSRQPEHSQLLHQGVRLRYLNSAQA